MHSDVNTVSSVDYSHSLYSLCSFVNLREASSRIVEELKINEEVDEELITEKSEDKTQSSHKRKIIILDELENKNEY